MPQPLARQFFSSFSAQDALVQKFLQEIPSIPAMVAAISPGTTLMIYSLAHSSVIQLHRPFIAINTASRGRIISAVRSIVHILDTINVAEVVSLNAFLAVSLLVSLTCGLADIFRRYYGPMYASFLSK